MPHWLKNLLTFILTSLLLIGSLFLWPAFLQNRAPAPIPTILNPIGVNSILEEEPWQIAVHYPVATNPQVNQIITSFIDQQLLSFKSTAGLLATPGGELTIGFTHTTPPLESIATTSANLVIFDFQIERHIPSAEPLSQTTAFTFDLDSGQELELNTLSIAPSSALVIPSLTKTSFLTPSEPHAPPPLETRLEQLQGQSLVALTFDDGPDETLTPQLLEFLDQSGVKVTFFVIGSRAAYYPEILQQADQAGHQIANHTTHHAKLTSLSTEQLATEINQTAQVVATAIHHSPTVLRPPYGEYNASVIAQAAQPLILWSIDPQDWRYRDAQRVTKQVLAEVKDGSIILLHDIHPTSIAAAQLIIPALQEKGFAFATIDEMLALRGRPADQSQVYRFFPPVASSSAIVN